MIRVAVLLPVKFESGGELLADIAALDAAGAYAVCVGDAGPESWVVLGAVAGVTHQARIGIVTRDEHSAEAFAALDRISGGRALAITPGEAWKQIDMPANRVAWKDTLRTHETAGAEGVIVAWDQRLIDLLRSPDADDDRSDLLMSTG